MTFEQFREKLTPFFTPSQIGHLDDEAIQSALDAHGKPGTLDTLRDLHYMGREFICNLIYDYIESDPAFIEKLSGDVIPWEKRKALIMQFDIEW